MKKEKYLSLVGFFSDIFKKSNEWIDFEGFSYYVSSSRTNDWDTAKADCEARGAKLAQFDTERELDFASSLAHQLFYNGSLSSGDIFFGNK